MTNKTDLKQQTDSTVDLLEGITPGPWYLSPNNTYVRANGVHGWNIANIEDQPPYTKANARLIAAAPTLAAENKSLKEHNALLVQALENIAAWPGNLDDEQYTSKSGPK